MISPGRPLPMFPPRLFAGIARLVSRLRRGHLRLGCDELLPAVDVVGRTREGSVSHDVYG
jgi:hypothetical protein